MMVSTSEYFSPTDFNKVFSVDVLLTPGAFMANFMPLRSVSDLICGGPIHVDVCWLRQPAMM